MEYSDSLRRGPSRRYNMDDDEDFDLGSAIRYSAAASERVHYNELRDPSDHISAAPRRSGEDAIPPGPPLPPPEAVYAHDGESSTRRPEYGGTGLNVRHSTRPEGLLTYTERLERREREEPVEYLEIPRNRQFAPTRLERELGYDDPGPSMRRSLRPKSQSDDEERDEYVEEIRVERLEPPHAHDEGPLRAPPAAERPVPRILRHHGLPREHRVPRAPRSFLTAERPIYDVENGGRAPPRGPPGGPPRGPPRGPPMPPPYPGPRRRLPPGFVQPAPPLMHPEKVSGHDLASLAQRPNPSDGEDVRDNLVLCIYRNSKKTFDYRTVELTSSGNRLGGRSRLQITTDRSLFYSMRSKYENQLRGWIRRVLSFKALTTVRLLQYGSGQFFRPDQDDVLFSLTFMKIWRNPNGQLGKQSVEWVTWIIRAKALHPEFDMAIELIEDYIPERIVLFVGIGLIGIVALTSAWLVEGGDPGNVSTVMSFALAFVAACVALTGIWDWFDGGRSKEMQQQAVVMLSKEFQQTSRQPPIYIPRLMLKEDPPEVVNEKRPKFI